MKVLLRKSQPMLFSLQDTTSLGMFLHTRVVYYVLGRFYFIILQYFGSPFLKTMSDLDGQSDCLDAIPFLSDSYTIRKQLFLGTTKLVGLNVVITLVVCLGLIYGLTSNAQTAARTQ